MCDKKSEYLTFRATIDTKIALEKESKELDRPMSWLINKIVTDYIGNQNTQSVQMPNHTKSIG